MVLALAACLNGHGVQHFVWLEVRILEKCDKIDERILGVSLYVHAHFHTNRVHMYAAR